jgi:hypothetical protein
VLVSDAEFSLPGNLRDQHMSWLRGVNWPCRATHVQDRNIPHCEQASSNRKSLRGTHSTDRRTNPRSTSRNSRSRSQYHSRSTSLQQAFRMASQRRHSRIQFGRMGSWKATRTIRNRGAGIAFEPRGTTKWTVAGEIRKRRQITTLNVRSLLHPRRIVLNVLTDLRPAACQMPCLHLP